MAQTYAMKLAGALFGMTKTCPKTVWITRTQPSADETAQAIFNAGFNVIIAPLLTVENLLTEAKIPNEAVLLFTSQNGVRAFCNSHNRRDFSVITVGDATAKLACELGFNDVRSAGGTSGDIAPLISRSSNTDVLYLHISGNHVRGSAAEDIRALGLRAERRIYYRSAPVQALPDIDVAKIDIAALFSPLAAQTLAALSPETRHMQAVSISRATDSALGTLEFHNRRAAKAPTLESLIAALKQTG